MNDPRHTSFLCLYRRLAVLVLSVLILNGCATPRKTQPPVIPVAPPPPLEYKPVTGPAAGLYRDADRALQAGKLAESEMLLERALRIEPHNPHYWHAMAQVKYKQKKYRETIQFCLKSQSLAGKQPQLSARNEELLRQAKQAAQSH